MKIILTLRNMRLAAGIFVILALARISCAEEIHGLGCKMGLPPPTPAPVARSTSLAGALTAPPPSVDLTPSVPPVFDQGSLGSCCSCAVGYTVKGYMETIDRLWDNTQAAHQFAPNYLYNQVDGGADNGSYPDQNFNIITWRGISTLQAQPYNQNDCVSWPTQSQCVNAQDFRDVESGGNTSQYTGTVASAKALLASGIALATTLQVDSAWDNLGAGTNYVWFPNRVNIRGGHCVAIIGYDDSVTDGNGHVGAFRVQNQWGTGWANGGRCWIAYDGYTASGGPRGFYYATERPNFTSRIKAQITVNCPNAAEIFVTLGVGDTTNPVWQYSYYYQMGGIYIPGSFPPVGPNLGTALDMSDAAPYWPPTTNRQWWVKITAADTAQGHTASLAQFQIVNAGQSFNSSTPLPVTVASQSSSYAFIGNIGNPPPVASFTASTTSGTAPLLVNTNASASTGVSLSYAWTFGDGSFGSGVTASHTYGTPGTYTLTLTVTDSQLQTASASKTIAVAAPQYTLTVVNGSGSGSYVAGAIVNVVANAPPTGQVFNQWTGATVANASASSTMLTMPAANTTVTATYKDAPPPQYALTVVNGSGSGSYTAGTVVTIAANTPPAGQVFNQWTGATVANASAASTALTMPAANTTVTATYKDAPPPLYTLTVVNGSASGTYTAGTIVTIAANAPPADQVFNQWTGATVANASAASTTLTMPAANTVVNATYVNVNAPPVITSQATAAPNPALAGAPVTLTSGASDADGDPLTYAWSFGDGASSPASTVSSASHSYTPGTFTATITVTNGHGGSATSSVTVVVSDPGALTITQASGKVFFNAQGSDYCTVAGKIASLPAGFKASGAIVTINAGGAAVSFKLSSSGTGKTGSSTFALHVSGTSATFTAALKKGTWASAWSLIGMANRTISGARISMPVMLMLNSSNYAGSKADLYTAKVNASGTFK